MAEAVATTAVASQEEQGYLEASPGGTSASPAGSGSSVLPGERSRSSSAAPRSRPRARPPGSGSGGGSSKPGAQVWHQHRAALWTFEMR